MINTCKYCNLKEHARNTITDHAFEIVRRIKLEGLDEATLVLEVMDDAEPQMLVLSLNRNGKDIQTIRLGYQEVRSLIIELRDWLSNYKE